MVIFLVLVAVLTAVCAVAVRLIFTRQLGPWWTSFAIGFIVIEAVPILGIPLIGDSLAVDGFIQAVSSGIFVFVFGMTMVWSALEAGRAHRLERLDREGQ